MHRLTQVTEYGDSTLTYIYVGAGQVVTMNDIPQLRNYVYEHCGVDRVDCAIEQNVGRSHRVKNQYGYRPNISPRHAYEHSRRRI